MLVLVLVLVLVLMLMLVIVLVLVLALVPVLVLVQVRVHSCACACVRAHVRNDILYGTDLNGVNLNVLDAPLGSGETSYLAVLRYAAVPRVCAW